MRLTFSGSPWSSGLGAVVSQAGVRIQVFVRTRIILKCKIVNMDHMWKQFRLKFLTLTSVPFSWGSINPRQEKLIRITSYRWRVWVKSFQARMVGSSNGSTSLLTLSAHCFPNRVWPFSGSSCQAGRRRLVHSLASVRCGDFWKRSAISLSEKSHLVTDFTFFFIGLIVRHLCLFIYRSFYFSLPEIVHLFFPHCVGLFVAISL